MLKGVTEPSSGQRPAMLTLKPIKKVNSPLRFRKRFIAFIRKHVCVNLLFTGTS